jgi:zinc and cadmium transporter
MTLLWILLGGALMSLVSLVGGLTMLIGPGRLHRLLLPMVALAAGSLMGGAFFHMIPEGLAGRDPLDGSLWVVAGFSSFLLLEVSLHWHHSHTAQSGAGQAPKRPEGLLILLGDGLHNFMGGVGISSTFLMHPAAGVVAWLAAVAHEIPQELGDFAVLVHSGWNRRTALVANLIAALTFPLGGLLAWSLAGSLPLGGLTLFAAGNFLYIAASDLVPQIKEPSKQTPAAASSVLWFAVGLILMLLLARPGLTIRPTSPAHHGGAFSIETSQPLRR